MASLFSKMDKKYSINSDFINDFHKIISDKITEENFILLVHLVSKACDYHAYWKEKCSICNETLINLKKIKTQIYNGAISKKDLQIINERLYWWRSYYKEVIAQYHKAKTYHNEALKYYNGFNNSLREPLDSAKTVKGEHVYEITIKNKFSNKIKRFYFRSCDISNNAYLTYLKNEFKYWQDLMKFDYEAYWNLSCILNQVDNPNIAIEIKEVKVPTDNILIDFCQFFNYRIGTLHPLKKMTYSEAVSDIEYNAGSGACKGFDEWLLKNLSKKYRKTSVDETLWFIKRELKKTFNWWRKYYDMYEKGVMIVEYSKVKRKLNKLI